MSADAPLPVVLPEWVEYLKAFAPLGSVLVLAVATWIAVAQLLRVNRNARISFFFNWHQAYVGVNTAQLADPHFSNLLNQSKNDIFIHVILSLYEFTWRSYYEGEWSDEEFDQFEKSMDTFRRQPGVVEALNKAVYPFDTRFAAYIRGGVRPQRHMPFQKRLYRLLSAK